MDDIDREFIKYFEEATCVQGMDQSLGTLFGTLFLEPSEISMEELARRTGYSLASISTKVKALEQIGIIMKLRKPHTKKIFLYMDKDFSQLIKKFLVMKQKTVLAVAKQRLPCILQKNKGKKLTENQKKKMIIIDHYYRDILMFEEMINKMIDKFDHIDKSAKR